MAARPVKIGVGMREKRARILRSLDAHIRYLATVETMAPWQPTPRTWEPRPAQTRAEWDAYWAAHAPVRTWSPRERPELRYPHDGLAAMTEEQVKSWVAVDPFVRGGLSERTQRAMAFIETFAPKKAPGILAGSGAA